MSHQVTIGNKKDDFLNIMSQDPEAILILLLILKKNYFMKCYLAFLDFSVTTKEF